METGLQAINLIKNRGSAINLASNSLYLTYICYLFSAHHDRSNSLFSIKMKRFLLPAALLLLSFNQLLMGQNPRAEVYFITCGPGTESYSIYGHSALRIIIPSNKSDLVYNWGVFDFSAKHFIWKFAKGRLDYMLGVFPYDSFMQEYRSEKRWVVSQKVNLTDEEMITLFSLINDNLKPENVKYRYDFLYDNCSTRIRDLFEKTFGNSLIYPPPEARIKLPTFRELIENYQRGYPWLNLGINIVLGSPVDKKVGFRDRMFLPIDLKNNLTESRVLRNGKQVPFLANPVTLLDFKSPVTSDNFLKSPFFLFSLLLILMVIFTAMNRKPVPNRWLDIILFSLFSVLSLLMIFFNFLTDHLETKKNFNIVWLNPFIIICLAAIIANRNWTIWFRLTFFLALAFLVVLLVVPQDFGDATFPLLVMLILRSSVRSGFSWNPLSLPYLTEL